MSFGFFGIQFGWGLQMANMTTIYEYLGADPDQIPLLWLAAPLTGLIVQPIVGYYSDRTWGRLGRRRPFFLVGAILASLALIAMPNSPSLWMAAGLLWILDASVNISMEPFRAFVGDMLPSEQRKSGFAMQSLLIGAGAVLASALPFILTEGFGVSAEPTTTSPIPPAVHIAFYVGAGIFFAAVLYTILTTKEYPPDDIEAFHKKNAESAGVGRAFKEIFQGIASMPRTMKQLAIVQFFTWLGLFCMWLYFVPGVAKGVFEGEPLGVRSSELRERFKLSENPDQVDTLRALDSAVLTAEAYERLKSELADAQRSESNAAGVGDALLRMLGLKASAADVSEGITPEQLRPLIEEARRATVAGALADAEKHGNALVQTIAELLLEQEEVGFDAGVAAAGLSDRLAGARAYQRGASWGGVCFAVYNLVAFLFAFVLLALVRKFSARSIHRLCLFCGGLGLILAVTLKAQYPLILSMLLVGVAWASILSMPYAMLANAIPAAKMGFYMGVFNFFIVLPQILAALALGKVMQHWLGGNPMNAVLLGGGAMILAGLCVGLVSKQVDEVVNEDPA